MGWPLGTTPYKIPRWINQTGEQPIKSIKFYGINIFSTDVKT